MPVIQCPQCRTRIQAPEQGEARCPNCGFTAPVGAPSASPAASPPGQGTFSAAPTMAPAAPQAIHGKPRKFWTSFFLGIITFGIYYLVWNYKSFRELDQQHGTKHEELFYWLALVFVIVPVPLVGPILFLVYAHKEITKIEGYRRQRGLSPGPSPGLFIALVLLGIITLWITTIVGYHKLTRSQNEIWRDVYERGGTPWPLTT